jgi:hypothetical protein
MNNTDLYIVVPDWALWLFTIGLLVSLVNNLLEIYIFRLKKNLKKLEQEGE